MKRWIVVLGIVVVLAAVGVAVAAGGTAGNPLISQSYLEGTYRPRLMAQVQEQINTSTGAVYDRVLAQAQTGQTTGQTPAGSYNDGFHDDRYKKDDRVTGVTGTGFLLLAGQAVFSYSGGTVVDVSTGAEVASGTALLPDHRYLTAEDTRAAVIITSDTAVLSLDGYYDVTPSNATDYNALADALKALGIFRGSDTPYGSGYALEEQPTRIQGLVMFLRLIGEEDEALASTVPNPFRDTDPWCDRYVAYAYAMGYTKGTDDTRGIFSPSEPITATQYLTFLLRALGYRDDGTATADFTWDLAIPAAVHFGVLTEGEQAMLESNTFYRAQMVYVSWFGLQARCKDSGKTALQRLIDSGAVSAAEAERQMKTVTVARL